MLGTSAPDDLTDEVDLLVEVLDGTGDWDEVGPHVAAAGTILADAELRCPEWVRLGRVL